MKKSILTLIAVFVLVSAAQAGVVCKTAQPSLSGETQAFLQKIAQLQTSQKLGACEVRVFFQDICEEETQAFLYRGFILTIGTDPNLSTTFGFDHFDVMSLNFLPDGKMILDPNIQKFKMSSNTATYEYHEAGGSDYFTTISMTSNAITSWDFVETDSDKNIYEHLVCGSSN